jgi:hypothetical protein
VSSASAPGPLSQSPLWRWSRQFYEREAADAWAHGKVPWRITNSVRVAHAYAQLIAAWRGDLVAGGVKSKDVPVQILELGGGSGRLAFHLTRWLEEARVPYQLTWTDAASSSIDAFRGRAFVRRRPGVIEALRLDAVDEQLGPPLAPDVVIASYLFDSLPHDAWSVTKGRVRPVHVGVTLPPGSGPECDRADVSWLEADSEVPPFVRGYAPRVGEGRFLLPVGAFKCLERVTAWSHGRTLVLVADKGEPNVPAGPLKLQRHGGVSAMVNFDALKAWWGWRPWLSSGEAELGFYALAQGLPSLPQTRAVWSATFLVESPLQKLRALDLLLASQQPVSVLLQALAAWDYDPDVLVRLAEPLRAQAPHLHTSECAALVEAIDRSWERHYELNGPMDVAFEMATVLHRAGQLSHAARFYERSLGSHGRHATVCFNLALCRLDLGQRDEGANLLREVLAIAPGHTGAARVLATLAISTPA